jgi:signal transduction histidine kinase/CheY-like chemotaxis protein
MSTPERTADSTFNRVAADLTHQAYPELAAAIRARIARVLKCWRALSLKAMPHLEALTLEEFEDTIAVILSAAADAFHSANAQKLRGVMEQAPSHGVDRFVQQHSLLDLFEELRLLRGVVVVEIAEQMQRPLDVGEAATFHAVFDIVIQQGVMSLVGRQSEELRQSQAVMREMNGQLMEAVVRHDELLAQARVMQDQIAEQTKALEGESRRKDEFLAMLSHELRNPLAPIRAAIHLLKAHERGSENPIQQQAREIIERQVVNLTKLVSDLLEVSRVVNGRIRLSLQALDLNQVVRHAVETTKPSIDQHKHTLTLNLCDGVYVNGDATRMEEVFINLLSNAVKYTPDGGAIEVDCDHHREANHAVIRVRDNGVGISQELLRGGRIFDLFTQADRSLDRSQGGLGIGLSLAHRLVNLHGGTIEAQSPPAGREVGSEFIVRLPLLPAPLPPAPQEAPASEEQKPEGERVLVIDDNIDLVAILASALRHRGYSVQVAYNGPDGLKVALQWRPDIVLLDIGLPGLDGYELARRLRADGATCDVRLIALTGYGRDSDIAMAREAGFDGHLVKPVDFEDLHKMMASSRR